MNEINDQQRSGNNIVTQNKERNVRKSAEK